LAPITENIGKVTRVLKMKLTPFEAGLKETYKWYVRNHKPRTAGFEFDDKVLALAKAGSALSV
jgi:dTDP-D-glucose 4,6-dehydratase